VVDQVTFVDECETVVLDGLWDGGRDCDNAGDGFRIFWGSARMLRYRVDKNRKKPPTRLDITSVVSLPFLLLLFEVVGYPRVRTLAFAPPGRLLADSRWPRVKRRPG